MTVSETNPGTTRVRVKHAFAHVSCFSTRDAGKGVGKSTLVPKVSAKELVEPGGSGAGGVKVKSFDKLHGADVGDGANSEASNSMTLPLAPTSPSSSTRSRKRKRGHDMLVTPVPSPSLVPDASTSVMQADSSSHPAPLLSDQLPPKYDASFAVQNEVENRSRTLLLHSEVPAHHQNVQLNHWSDGQATHWRPFSPSPPIRIPVPSIPPIEGNRVVFPLTYLNELRRKVEVAFSEAARPGGLTVHEARAFESAFSPISAMVLNIESARESGT